MLLLYILIASCYSIWAEPIRPLADWYPKSPRRPNTNGANFGIVGGETVPIEDFPYIVNMELSEWSACSGIIISDHYVLTSAICGERAEFYRIFSSGSSSRVKNVTLHEIEKLILHEGFDPIKSSNAISLIRVSEPFDFTGKNRQPAILADSNEKIPDGKMGNVSGWGSTTDMYDPERHFAQDLQMVSLPVYEAEKCFDEEFRKRYPEYFCAGYNEGNSKKGACLGDSGSPLVVDGKVVGFASMTMCGMGRPDIFISVSHYRDWIDAHSK